MSHEAKLSELAIVVPAAPKAGGNYVPAVRVGNLLFVSGCAPRHPDGLTSREK
jgi:enamine deaminase RidA (YjgF/YER057c/UK114 family)